MIYISPFGFSDAQDKYVKDLTSRVWGQWYPERDERPISIALYQDSMWPRGHAQWPQPYAEHAAALEDIASRCPRAIVVDIRFTHQFHGAQDITFSKREIDRIKNPSCKSHVSLYFIESDFTLQIRKAGAEIVDPHFFNDYGMVREYPIHRDTCGGPDSDKAKCGVVQSLAVQVYCDLYKTIDKSRWCEPANSANWRIQLIAGERTRCRPFWPWSHSSCSDPLFDEIPIDKLGTGKLVNERNEDLIDGRIVFYGAHLKGWDDEFATAASATTPGVQVHAMALDNLIAYHGRPYINILRLFGVNLREKELQFAISVPVMLSIAGLFTFYLRRKAAQWQEKLNHSRPGSPEQEYLHAELHARFEEWRWSIVAFVVSLFIGLPLSFWADITPAIWLSVSFLSMETLALMIVFASIWYFVLGRIRAARIPVKSEEKHP